MCGIIGAFPSTNIDSRYIRHRGPDSQGITVLPEITMGHTRLSILDLTEHAAQPKTSANNNVLMSYNGEIYNYKALIDSEESSDTVALVEWLAQKGIDFDASLLDGMYAFAAFFCREKTLVLCRDSVGIKPLYIAFSDDGELLAFSSEIKGFFGVDWFKSTPAMDKDVIEDFLQYGYTYPRSVFIRFSGKENQVSLIPTLIKNVYQLCPGQKLIISMDRPFRHSFVRLSQFAGNPRDVLTASIREQSMADVEVGVQLSGGIDSSLVALEYAAQNSKVHGFYVSVPYKGLCEDEWAEFVASEISKRSEFAFHKISATFSEIMRVLPSVVWHMDEPAIRHPNAIGIYLLCEYVRRNTAVKVLLTGEGADEIFGGYSWHDGKTMKDYDKSRRIFDLGGSPIVSQYLTLNAALPVLSQQLLYDRALYLPPILARQDRMSMAHSIEARVPFLSNRFLGLPSPDRPGKIALKEMAQKIFGRRFTKRPKIGFGFPLSWLEEIRPTQDSLDWLPKQMQPKKEIQTWAMTALSLWARAYFYGERESLSGDAFTKSSASILTSTADRKDHLSLFKNIFHKKIRIAK